VPCGLRVHFHVKIRQLRSRWQEAANSRLKREVGENISQGSSLTRQRNQGEVGKREVESKADVTMAPRILKSGNFLHEGEKKIQ